MTADAEEKGLNCNTGEGKQDAALVNNDKC